MADSSQDDQVRRGDITNVANEFAHVQVRKVWTRNGERLEIVAPRLNHQIRLDPLELESLTWQTTETFSRFLESPYGPPSGDDENGGGPG